MKIKPIITYITILFSIFPLVIFSQNNIKEVIIAGIITNPRSNTPIKVMSNDFLGYKTHSTKVNSDRTFKLRINVSHAHDIWVDYHTNFKLLVHPGDSIFIEMNGKYQRRKKLLQKIKFSGSATTSNTQLAAYQKLYYAKNFWGQKRGSIEKNSTADAYKIIRKEIYQKEKAVQQQFIREFQPNEEVKKWIELELKSSYLKDLIDFPSKKRSYNNLKREDWEVKLAYYDFIKTLPIYDSTFLISTNACMYLVSTYIYNYIAFREVQKNPTAFKGGYPDSIMLSGIINHSKINPFLKELSLAYYLNGRLGNYDKNSFEKHFPPLKKAQLTYQPLIDFLENHHKQLTTQIESPTLSTKAVLEMLPNKDNILKTIIDKNKGKVQYLDFWAPWCNPCIGEFPKAKKLQEQYGKKITFVYFGIDCKENSWKNGVKIHELAGQHYFLNRTESANVRKALEIKGIPFYVLIDQAGNIIEKGSHLRPSREKINNKIEKLLRIN